MNTSEKSQSFGKRLLQIYKSIGIFIILIVLMIGITILTPKFLTVNNLITVVRQISFIAIIGLGGTFVIITGGIDLSPGSIVGLASVTSVLLLNTGQNLVFSILAGILVGCFCGCVNGFLVTITKIPSFIATLGMMEMGRGVAMLLTKGRPVALKDPLYIFLGNGALGFLPVPVFILLIISLLLYILLVHTPFGRRTMALGGNPQAAKISGINVTFQIISIYALAGLLSAIAGILMTGRLASGQPSLGEGYEMDGIAAAVIGGTSLSGGVGSIWGTMCGALVIGVINNGMDLLSISSYWQQIIKGAIIILAVVLDQLKLQKN